MHNIIVNILFCIGVLIILVLTIFIALINRRSRKKDNHSPFLSEQNTPKTPKRTPKPKYVNTMAISNPAFGEDMEDGPPSSDSSSSSADIKETVIDMGEKQEEPMKQHDGDAKSKESSEGDKKSDKTQEEHPLVIPLVVISDETEVQKPAEEEILIEIETESRGGHEETMLDNAQASSENALQEAAGVEEEREPQNVTEAEIQEEIKKDDEETAPTSDKKPAETTGSEEAEREIGEASNEAAAAAVEPKRIEDQDGTTPSAAESEAPTSETGSTASEARESKEDKGVAATQNSEAAQDNTEPQNDEAAAAEQAEHQEDKGAVQDPQGNKETETEEAVKLRGNRDDSEEREIDEQRRGSLIESENEQEYVLQGEVSDGEGTHMERRLKEIAEEQQQQPILVSAKQPDNAAESKPVAEEGNLVAESKPVAEEGKPVAESKPVAEEGKPVAEEGKPVAEEGKPVAEEGNKSTEQESVAADRAVQSEIESNLDDDEYQEPDTVITLI